MINIFDKIERLSYNLAYKISNKYTKVNKYSQEFKDEVELYEYCFFLLFSNLLEFSAIIVIGTIFGYGKILLAYIPIWIISRWMIGGNHNDSFCGCFWVSSIVYFIGCMMAKYTSVYYYIVAMVALFMSVNIIPHSPFSSLNSPSRGLEIDMKFRCRFKNFVLIFLIGQIVLFWLIKNGYNLNFVSTGMSSAVIMAVIMTTKSSKKLIDKFDGFIEKSK